MKYRVCAFKLCKGGDIIFILVFYIISKDALVQMEYIFGFLTIVIIS